MRDSLTLLAIMAIVVLTAALVGPHFVDWDSHRALIARRLSEAAGTPVTVSGRIDLKLLPKPVFRFGDVTVGDGRGGAPRLSMASLDAEVSLTALLRGQVQVVDTMLVRPRLDLSQAADGGFGWTLPSEAAADRVAIDHFGVRDGTVALRLADGRDATLAGLDLDGDATSLRGPFKLAGRFGAVPLRLATGTVDHGRLRLKLHLDGAGLRPALDLDGVASAMPPAGTTSTGAAGAGPGPGFQGQATLAGALPLDGTPATVPWRLTAHVAVDAARTTASDVELRAGTDLRALIAGGDGTAGYGPASGRPAAGLELHGATLDLDALAVAPASGSLAPPTGPDLLRLLARKAGSGAGLPWKLDIAAAFDTATLAGQTLLGSATRLGFGPEPTTTLSLAVEGPQGARVAFDGIVDPGPASPVAGPFGAAPVAVSATLRGRAEARSNDLKRTAAWLRPAAPDFADWLATVPGRSVAVSGTVDASTAGVMARAVDLHVDGAAFAGSLSVVRPSGAKRARLSADLTSDALELDRLPDLSAAAAAARGLDLDLSLAAQAVSVADPTPDGAPGRLGPVAAGHVAARLTRNGDAVTLERLALDVDGAEIAATASRTGRDARGDLHLSAPRLGPLADALAGLLPPWGAAALRARAGALSPVVLDLRIDALAATDDGPLAPTRFAVAGHAGGTRVEAALTPDAAGTAADAGARPVSLSLHLADPDGRDLPRQLGLEAASPAPGAARIDATGRGTLAGGFAATVRAALPGATLSYAGRAEPRRGSGRLTLQATDIRAALAVVGADVPAAIPTDIGADVAWDDLRLDARRIAGQVGGVAAEGELSLDLDGRAAGDDRPALRGRLALDKLSADTLLAPALGAPTPGSGSPWSPARWSPAPSTLPRSEIALTVGRLTLRGPLDGTSVSLALRTGGGAVTLADASGRLRGGAFGGTLTLRRDGPAVALSGRTTWRDVALDGGGLSGRTSGTMELAGSGDSPAAVVASLGGTGSVALQGAALVRIDPAAPGRIAAAVAARDAVAERGAAADPTPPDPDVIRRDLAAALDHAPLPLPDGAATAALAGGVLRFGPLKSAGAPTAGAGRDEARPRPWSAETAVTLDLGALTLATRTALRGFGDGDVTVARAGPLGGETRTVVDVTGLVGAVQAAAIARAQDRIDVMEQDIRERAFFNRQLKAEQQAARDRAEAERQARAARAAAEAQAKADAAEEMQRAAAKAAADLRAAADARRAEAARQKAEDARLQAEVQAAARADAAAKQEAEKQRFIDKVLAAPDPPLDLHTRDAPLARPRSPARRGGRPDDGDPFAAPPSIIQDRSAAPARDPFAPER